MQGISPATEQEYATKYYRLEKLAAQLFDEVAAQFHAAAPPSRVMNSRRRIIRSPRRGGLEIDHQLVFGRLLDRQVSRLFAFENRAA